MRHSVSTCIPEWTSSHTSCDIVKMSDSDSDAWFDVDETMWLKEHVSSELPSLPPNEVAPSSGAPPAPSRQRSTSSEESSSLPRKRSTSSGASSPPSSQQSSSSEPSSPLVRKRSSSSEPSSPLSRKRSSSSETSSPLSRKRSTTSGASSPSSRKCSSSSEASSPPSRQRSPCTESSSSPSSIKSSRSSTYATPRRNSSAEVSEKISHDDPGEGTSRLSHPKDSSKVEILKTSRNHDLLVLNGYVFYKNRGPVSYITYYFFFGNQQKLVFLNKSQACFIFCDFE